MTRNVALNSRTFSSSSIQPFDESRAVDGSGSPLSRWLCGEVPCWMAVDLGNPVYVDRWVVSQMGAYWQSTGYNINSYILQGSTDNVNWTTIDSVRGNSQYVTDRTFKPTNYRYYRVYVERGLNVNPDMASIEEFGLYSAEPTSSLLTNISLSEGILNPSFSPTTSAYTAIVSYDTSSITVKPRANDPNATIRVNSEIVKNNENSQLILLSDSVTTIKVDVTPVVPGEDSEYVIDIEKGSSPYLSEIVISGYMGKPVIINPEDGIFDYTTTVPSNASSVKVKPTAEDPTADITVNGNKVASGDLSEPIPISSGNNTITITVTPSIGGSEVQYNITVRK